MDIQSVITDPRFLIALEKETERIRKSPVLPTDIRLTLMNLETNLLKLTIYFQEKENRRTQCLQIAEDKK